MSKRGENIYKRKDGRWEARVLTDTGKYKYLYSKSYKDVKEKKKIYYEEKNEEKPTFAESASSRLEWWLDNYVIRHVKPSTYDSYYYCMRKYIISHFKDSEDDSFSDNQVFSFITAVTDNSLISESNKRKILSVFKSALAVILKEYPNEWQRLQNIIKLPKSDRREIQVFSVKEQRMIEDVVLRSKNKNTLGILLCFYTGIRLGELCALRWRNIDLDAKTMFIDGTIGRIRNTNNSPKRTALTIGQPKSNNSLRKIPLPYFLVDIMLSSTLACRNPDYFVLTNSEKPADPRSYQRLFKSVLKKADVIERNFHATRHTFATRALETGMDIKTLSEILGHSNITITLNIYAHSLMDHKRKAIEKMNDLFLMNPNYQQSKSPSETVQYI